MFDLPEPPVSKSFTETCPVYSSNLAVVMMSYV